MKRLFAAGLFAIFSCSQGAVAGDASAGVPEGVHYTPGSETEMAAAATRLRDALKGGPTALAPLLGLDADHTVVLGPYVGLDIHDDGLDGRSVLSKATYRQPANPVQPEMVVDSFRAKTRAQKLLVAHYLNLAANFSGPITIRSASYDELALIWAWIAWNIDGPLLIVETASDKYAFQFNPENGLLFWVERLSRPCFTVVHENQKYPACTCTRVARDGKKWGLRFEPQQSCPALGLALVTAAAAGSDTTKTPAYIEVTASSARVDAMLARRFGRDYAITALPDAPPGYTGPGKVLEGSFPDELRDARGEPLHAYVLVGSVIGTDGRSSDNRVLLSTDERASAAVLEVMKSFRLEPATRDGKPVAELVWQQLTF